MSKLTPTSKNNPKVMMMAAPSFSSNIQQSGKSLGELGDEANEDLSENYSQDAMDENISNIG